MAMSGGGRSAAANRYLMTRPTIGRPSKHCRRVIGRVPFDLHVGFLIRYN